MKTRGGATRQRGMCSLTHVTPENKPSMVSVVGKQKSFRVAVAESTIVLPSPVMAALDPTGTGTDLSGKKVPSLCGGCGNLWELVADAVVLPTLVSCPPFRDCVYVLIERFCVSVAAYVSLPGRCTGPGVFYSNCRGCHGSQEDERADSVLSPAAH